LLNFQTNWRLEKLFRQIKIKKSWTFKSISKWVY